MRVSTALLTATSCAALSSAATLFAVLMVGQAPEALPTTMTVDPLVLVGQVRELSRLETASVSLTTTVRAQRGEGWMKEAVGEELVFMGVGEASAGVDLDQLQADDVWVDGAGVVWVRLPAAEIWRVDLDEQRSQVVHRDVGWFGTVDPELESEVRRVAQQRLWMDAEAAGLRETAADRAQVVLSELFDTMGVHEVRFVSTNSA